MNTQTQTLQQQNIDFVVKFRKAKLAEYKDIKIATYNTVVRGGETKPAMQIWMGKQKNPYYNYYCSDARARNIAIKVAKEKADDREEYKVQKKAEKQAFVPEFEVGDIFYTSWGYEQTNVDFFQVIEKVGKHTAMVQEIAQEQVDGSMISHGMACDVTAIKDGFIGDPFKKRVTKYGIKISECQQGYKWDGKPKYKSWYY